MLAEIFKKLVVVVGLSFHTQSSPCIPREAVGRKSKHPVRHLLSYRASRERLFYTHCSCQSQDGKWFDLVVQKSRRQS